MSLTAIPVGVGGGKGSIGDYLTVPRLVATAIPNTSLGESLIMLASASRRDEIPPDAFGCDEVGETAYGCSVAVTSVYAQTAVNQPEYFPYNTVLDGSACTVYSHANAISHSKKQT